MKSKQIVGGAIVDDLQRPSRLLVARRSAPESSLGLWEFPGGKVEIAELPEAALHRELAEELGVQVKLGHEVTGPDTDG
ncbi:NUDIX hydrolase [Renibacterium salmoninarum ATCC 33209]|uniref:8-oxo-dGTP diphosphatase n=1 Tax=Renibacterium salmoninarum (strain ATCC 33209 / DSM 20767 / JCM 11484 / NBRC 15589 / NCIMB 2235) TaxID=288705 RepID=A9WQB5_RENSM|nr:NUDIX domain-containing protein [Renibacterium salmoninarum]ABY22498.1 NUDIX hydrolase [Renibacterium salmoninarum ATCC 33209]